MPISTQDDSPIATQGDAALITQGEAVFTDFAGSLTDPTLYHYWPFDESGASDQIDDAGAGDKDLTLFTANAEDQVISVSGEWFDTAIDLPASPLVRAQSALWTIPAVDVFSLCGWVKTTNTGATGGRLYLENNSGNSRGILTLVSNTSGTNGRLRCLLRDQTSTTFRDFYIQTPINDDAWHHVGFWYDKVADTHGAWLDGVPATITTTVNTTGQSLYTGSVRQNFNATDFSGNPLGCAVRDWRKYLRILSDDELAIVKAGAPTEAAGISSAIAGCYMNMLAHHVTR